MDLSRQRISSPANFLLDFRDVHIVVAILHARKLYK
jgi:hypothetical protein